MPKIVPKDLLWETDLEPLKGQRVKIETLEGYVREWFVSAIHSVGFVYMGRTGPTRIEWPVAIELNGDPLELISIASADGRSMIKSMALVTQG